MGRSIALFAKIAAGVFIVFMWFYAFVLAPRESANNIKDKAWSARSEATCRKAADQRTRLADLSRVDPSDPAALSKKADIIDKAREEVDKMKAERDPIDHVRDLLLKAGADEAQLKQIDREVKDRIAEAAEFAQASPEPDPSELYTDILVEAR